MHATAATPGAKVRANLAFATATIRGQLNYLISLRL